MRVDWSSYTCYPLAEMMPITSLFVQNSIPLITPGRLPSGETEFSDSIFILL
jgi:hypothetical protein